MYMSGIAVTIHTSDSKGNVFTTLQALNVIWRDQYLYIPIGFESDGVSTPRFLWSTISPAIDPRTLRAGISHDFVYRKKPKGWTRAMADEMFYDLSREDGLSWLAAQKAYWGLRLFGGKAWSQN